MTPRGGHRRGGQQGRWKGWRGLGPEAPAPARNGPPVTRRMTAKQAGYLRDLCARAGIPFDPNWTRGEAARRIDMLKLAEQVSGKRR